MNEPWNGNYISKSVVDRGLSGWSGMAEELERTLPELVARVEECLMKAPWGGGAEGVAFRQAHLRDGGPLEMLSQCAELAKGVTDAGERVRKAIDNTRQTDADISHDLTAGLMREV
ncbi:hypothetical protein [Nonomuraea candida]|uniref:hypothetical protein n=1 Tax=Nonomuraea candida TaxID=359159 RepID=UPI0005B9D5D8|nr:hypothetical protein [Nonomuraea candida]